MDILHPKFQFEVRYTHILNFSSVVRDVISPYLKLASSFNISNQGMLEEHIKLNFDEDAFAIDVRWDRIILVSERDINRFNDENSQVNIFFQIIEKLSKSPSFGVFTNYLFLAILVKLVKDDYKSILTKFKKDYLTANTEKILDNPDDISIVFEKNERNKLISVSIGPYSQKDIANRNLVPFKSRELSDLIEGVGLMMEFKILETTSNINFAVFKDLIKFTNQYSKLL